MQRNISKIESSHPDIICPPGKSPGAQVKYCSLKCCLPYITYIYFLLQIVYIGSNQSVSYKTQHGETYGRNTKCVVQFKVSLLLLQISFIVYILFTEEQFLSLSGGVLPKVWHRPPKDELQGQRGGFSLCWEEEVRKHFHNKDVEGHLPIYGFERRCMHSNVDRLLLSLTHFRWKYATTF